MQPVTERDSENNSEPLWGKKSACDFAILPNIALPHIRLWGLPWQNLSKGVHTDPHLGGLGGQTA